MNGLNLSGAVNIKRGSRDPGWHCLLGRQYQLHAGSYANGRILWTRPNVKSPTVRAKTPKIYSIMSSTYLSPSSTISVPDQCHSSVFCLHFPAAPTGNICPNLGNHQSRPHSNKMSENNNACLQTTKKTKDVCLLNGPSSMNCFGH